MSEKIGGAEGTKFTDEFTQLERVSLCIDLTANLPQAILVLGRKLTSQMSWWRSCSIAPKNTYSPIQVSSCGNKVGERVLIVYSRIASRTKLMVSSKLKGAPGKPHTYPQPEGLLGEVMCKYGKELNEDSNFGKLLFESRFVSRKTNNFITHSTKPGGDGRSNEGDGRSEVCTRG